MSAPEKALLAVLLSYGQNTPSSSAAKGHLNITDAGAAQLTTGPADGAFQTLAPVAGLLTNAANIIHPYVQTTDGATAYVTNPGGGANSARFRFRLKDGAGNILRAVGKIGGAADVTGVTVTAGTAQDTTTPPGGGGGPYGLSVLGDATGLIDVTLAFNAAGAKIVSFDFGGFQLVLTAFAVS